MKVAFHTLGCKVNQYETEALREQFKNRGYETVSEDEFADIYVINTCTVTNLADRKSRQFIRKAKKNNPDSVVAVTGCYAQVSPEEVRELEGVDVIAGTGQKGKLLQLVEEHLAEGKLEVAIKSYENLQEYEDLGIIQAMESRSRAFVKIQEGCNRFCSYCIIPYARGKVRSRSEKDIVAEVNGLVESGYKEVVLTGINTALYGAESGNLGIAKLIKDISKIPKDFRIRLSSLEPTVINKDYVKELFSLDKLCHHLHLSIQSGSDDILHSMNRRYTRTDYLEIVNSLRDFDSDYGVTTDIIVGFPGESEEDFQDSIRMIDEAFFSDAHIFKYSKRKGTKAADMENQISGLEKNRRSSLLIERANESKRKFIQKNLNSKKRVLFERVEKIETEDSRKYYSTGYTGNYIKIYVPDFKIENEFENVVLKEAFKDGALGEIIPG